MIYLILLFISFLYFLLLYKNIGEKITLSKKTIGMNLIFIGLFIISTILFFKDSGVLNKQEYDEILTKHLKIRNNILTIKKNIPVLKTKLSKDPDYYQGWVMLAKSYIIIDKLLLSADAYEKAILIKPNDNLILEEYISVLRRIDPKSNRIKIIKTFDKLILLNSSDITIYNMKLNYSIEINDASLTKEILNNVIDNKLIKDKDPYIQALKQLNASSNKFSFEIMLSDKMFVYLKSMPHTFFILRDKMSGPPFAVKKIISSDLSRKIIISSENKMIKGMNLPGNVTLVIKGSKDDFVNDNMDELYRSEVLNLLSSTYYEVN
ncbi:MAG: hypothetical protein HOA76_01990 [Gammaproteobacteria bacterium]|nr:hypothetical protein [Gammaproteobacteria bacterium]